MNYNKVIVSIVLLCTPLVHAQDHWFFGTQPAPTPTPPVVQEYVCPIDPPLGYEVCVVLVDGDRFRRLGVWSKLTLAQKELARSYFDRAGGVTKDIRYQMMLLACGITSEKDPRFIELMERL